MSYIEKIKAQRGRLTGLTMAELKHLVMGLAEEDSSALEQVCVGFNLKTKGYSKGCMHADCDYHNL